MKQLKLMVILTLLSTSISLGALWQSTKVEIHRGYNYINPFAPEGTEYDATILSFSHANGWKYGDNFFWFDVTREDDIDSKVSIYGEFAPRFSIFKMAKADRSEKFFQELAVAGMIEFAPSDFVYLYGIGTSLNLPGFAFFNLNAYIRDDVNIDGITFMLNSSWALPFELGPVGFMFDGFVDFAGREGKDGAEIEPFVITQPALLLDIGNFWKKPNHLYLGSEVEIWYNKLGVEDRNQVVPQITFRWQF